MAEKVESGFEQIAHQQAEQGILTELWYFLRPRKRWWMIPIVAALLVFGTLVALGGTAIAPFIYTLF